MAKLTISDISSGYASTTALNAAFTAIETALENTLSRDGTSPNQMVSNLDMNGYAILNQRATSGNENFTWEGTWVTGTVYAVNNLVYAPEGTNEGATLICVTAHTAGATLDGDAAKWAVFAQRGAPGAGTGDVVGPASSTADSLARFNGTTGKLLKDGLSISSILALVYPVGSIYINASVATNPGTLLGFGTWAAFGAGRVPVGIDAGNASFDTAEETGGSADAVVVSHDHTATDSGHTHPSGSSVQMSGSFAAGSAMMRANTSSTTGSGTANITVSTNGVSGTNANLQPYIVVHMWKRTA